MDAAGLDDLEAALGTTLPNDYRASLLQYPLPRDPNSTELWLCDDVTQLKELNRVWRETDHSRTRSHLVVIGGDGGEELYLLHPGTPPFPVLVYSYETDEVEPYAISFQDFLERQHREHEAIEADRRQMNDAYANKRRWQFWIRPYPGEGA